MTRDEAVTLIKGRLSRRSDSALEEFIILELKQAQILLEGKAFLPWFLVSNDTCKTLTISQDYIGLPPDFLREYDDDAVWISGDSTCRKQILKKEDREVLSGECGKPNRYAIVGNYFYLGPVPDAAYSLRMIYYKQDTVLTENVENKWLKYASAVLIGTAGEVIAKRYVRNDVIAQEFRNEAREAFLELQGFNQARLDANREYWRED